MTRLAIANEPGFEISLLDAPATKPNYTIDTLHILHAQQPEAQLFCLLGADSFLTLRHWHRGAEVPFAAPLIVAARPGQSLADLNAQLPARLMLDAEPGPIPAPDSPILRSTRSTSARPLSATRTAKPRPSTCCPGCTSTSAPPRSAASSTPPSPPTSPQPCLTTSPSTASIADRSLASDP